MLRLQESRIKRIVDTLIEGGHILPECRDAAIAQLVYEMERETRKFVSNLHHASKETVETAKKIASQRVPYRRSYRKVG